MNAPANNSESTALAVATRQQFDLSPQTFEQALTFADYLAASEMVPKGYRGKPGDCLIAMQWGYELGLKPLQALQSIATINGKPGIYGDAGKAILLSKGCTIEEDDGAVVEKNGRARCKITRPGRPPVERTFSIDNAKTANLWGKEGPWRTYPWRQMAWRAFWFAARDAASDLLRGMAGFEELLDTPTEKNMGPADVVQTQAGAATNQAPALPEFTDAHLKEREQKIREFYTKGKTADEIIAFYSLKSTLSDAMKQRIRGMAPAAAATVQDVTPKGSAITYAHVAGLIHTSEDQDQLHEARQLIAKVEDGEQRAQLDKLAADRAEELPAF